MSSAAHASMKLKQVARPARGRKHLRPRVALRPARPQENEALRLQLRAAKLQLKQHEAVRPGPADRAGFDGAGFRCLHWQPRRELATAPAALGRGP